MKSESCVVISQPRYMPAVNYLQRAYFADVFVILDTVQRQARGVENRNKLLMPEPSWVTVPISSSSRSLIKDSLIKDTDWVSDHKQKITDNYKLHPCFSPELLDKWYYGLNNLQGFSEAMECMLVNICDSLSFSPNFVKASALETNDCPVSGPEKLLWLAEAVDATKYVSGANGRDYGVGEVFKKSNVGVRFHENDITPYGQPGRKEFVPYLSFMDIAFSCGLEFLRAEVIKPPILAVE